MDGATEVQLDEGLRAGRRVLEIAGVSPFDAVSTQFRLEQWDVNSFSDEFALSAAESHAYDALCAAANAANDAAVAAGADARIRGSIVARCPTKVRFEAARTRWAARQSKEA